IAGAGRQIEQSIARLQGCLRDDKAPPLHVLPHRHEPIHNVIAPGNATKHGLHVIRPFFTLKMTHSLRLLPACWLISTAHYIMRVSLFWPIRNGAKCTWFWVLLLVGCVR